MWDGNNKGGITSLASFLLVMVITAPELLNVMLILESAFQAEKVISEGGTKFAVRKNAKKPTRASNWSRMDGVSGALR